jgi:hypothetical protein
MTVKKLLAAGATLLIVVAFLFSPESCCGDFRDTAPPPDAVFS